MHAWRDPAINDAARTIMCGVNLALRNWTKKDKMKNTMQEVAHELEQHSRNTFVSKWGTILCCTRCGGRDHSDKCKAPVYCIACDKFDLPLPSAGDDIAISHHVSSHTEQYCLHVAAFKAWKRRVVDARRKIKHLPPGPPPGSHPPSNWRGIWPMTSPSDVLVPERPFTHVNEWMIPPADKVKTTAPPVQSVKAVALMSDARERAGKVRPARKKEVKPAAPQDVWNAEDAWN